MNPAYEKVTGYWRSEIVGNQKNNILSNCQVPSPVSIVVLIPSYLLVLFVVVTMVELLRCLYLESNSLEFNPLCSLM